MKTLKKILSLTLALTFISTQLGFAQVAVDLNIASHLGRIQAGMAYEKFRAPHLRYFSYDNATNNLGLILDKGDLKDVKEAALVESGGLLLKYFLIGVTLPDDNFWVNLRPDSKDNIIPELLARTDIGKIFLEADVQLKKDTAQLTSPNAPQGKLYWDKLYKKANELFGSDNISIPTLTRPWIVPGEIIIRESKDSAYIYKANLKVMLEEDHLKNSAVYSFKDPRQKALNDYSSQLIRELIIPQLTKEVNNAKRYASLRQAYYSLILARWFKNRFYGRGGLYASYINRANLEGLTSSESWSKENYFKAYQDSFNNGEYNIKTPVNTLGGASIRSYFSGGIDVGRNLNFLVQGGSSPIAAFTGKGAFFPAARNIGLVSLIGSANINLANNLKISSSPIDESASSPIDYAKVAEELNKNSIGMRLNRKYLFEIMDSKRFFVNINDIKEEMKDLRISESTVKAALDLWFGDKYAITSEKIKTGIDGQVQEKVVGFSLMPNKSSSPLEKETRENTPELGADDSDKQEMERFLETAKSSLRLQNLGLTPLQLQEAIKNNPSLLLSILKALDEEGSYKYKNLIKYISNSIGEAAKNNPSVSGMIRDFLPEDSQSSPIIVRTLNIKPAEETGRYRSILESSELNVLLRGEAEKIVRGNPSKGAAFLGNIKGTDIYYEFEIGLENLKNNQISNIHFKLQERERVKRNPYWQGRFFTPVPIGSADLLVERASLSATLDNPPGKAIESSSPVLVGDDPEMLAARFANAGLTDEVRIDALFRLRIYKTPKAVEALQQLKPMLEETSQDDHSSEWLKGEAAMGLEDINDRPSPKDKKSSSPFELAKINKAMELYKKSFGAESKLKNEAIEKYLKGEFTLSQAARVVSLASDDLIKFNDAKLMPLTVRLAAEFDFLTKVDFDNLRLALETVHEGTSAATLDRVTKILSRKAGIEIMIANEILDRFFLLYINALSLSEAEDQELQIMLKAKGRLGSSPVQNNSLKRGRAGLTDILLSAAAGSTINIDDLKKQLRVNDADIKAAISLVNSLNDAQETGMSIYSGKGLIHIPRERDSDSSSPVEQLINHLADRIKTSTDDYERTRLIRTLRNMNGRVSGVGKVLKDLAPVLKKIADIPETESNASLKEAAEKALEAINSPRPSSPVEAEGMKKGGINSPEEKLGGIDFRSLPMDCKPMGGFCGLNFALPNPAEVAGINVDKELEEINLMVERGIAPSGERVKELVAACYHKQELASRQQELMSCLMRICRLEEDMVVSSDKELKEAIVIIDSL